MVAQNFSEGELLAAILSGSVALPVDACVREPFVDADDIADVAVAALTDPRHAGETYEVTGPRSLTWSEAVAEIARAAGRPVGFTSVPLAAYLQTLASYAVPADSIARLSFLLTGVLDGRNEHLGDGVERALGRPPRDFGDFARVVAATGVWNTPVGVR